ncbi:F0F1 ATP synthase subunit delta [Alkalibaculum sp. M08DMB]|uniref:ATP synthase subunit delta n=1 Tax=Alkalibaculum sporogenes TaxID=2655001 RepID=A0A6A7KDB0_9FIRM|nr:F0F1 ATP synthase subunit delta [Alkalibaculum sporogenes]MPW27003.1 F0F1 ATP synthase subunit delta [Alkalibaculum sporogenes]
MSLASKKYSFALIEIAKQNNMLDEIYEEFKIIVTELTQQADIWSLMNIPSIETSQQKKLINTIFGDDINQYLYNFLMILFDKNRFNELEFIFLAFKDYYLSEKNTLEASILSVNELSEEHMKLIQVKLEKRYKKNILITNKLDESILGGLIVYVGDQVIDGSIKSQLNNMKHELKELRLQELGVN